jgi:hypothetical protein
LATATVVERGIVATLNEANPCLAKQLEESVQALKEVRVLLKKECNDRATRKPAVPSPDNYCWTHGYKIVKSHTSVNCMFPKNVHKREATKNNNTGGSQANKERLVGASSKNKSNFFEDWCTPPLLNHHDTVVVDLGFTGNYVLINAPCRNNTKYINPLRVRLPNGDTMD